MTLDELLQQRRAAILAQAEEALGRSAQAHYAAAGREITARRLATLYDLQAAAIRARDLAAVVRYAEELAVERYTAGYDLLEVQIAFNALEEAIWQEILAALPPEQLGEALGLVSTVHGAGKDALGRAYVALAAESKPPTLDLSALFAGTDGG